jgi:hypothetical protein
MRGDVARFTHLRLGYGDGLRLGLGLGLGLGLRFNLLISKKGAARTFHEACY